MICTQEIELCAVQGDDEAYNFTLTLDGTAPLDLTGSTVDLVVVPSKDSDPADAVITKSLTSITSPTLGKATINLTHTDTNLPIGTYFYRTKLTGSTGSVKTILKGAFKIVWAK